MYLGLCASQMSSSADKAEINANFITSQWAPDDKKIKVEFFKIIALLAALLLLPTEYVDNNREIEIFTATF